MTSRPLLLLVVTHNQQDRATENGGADVYCLTERARTTQLKDYEAYVPGRNRSLGIYTDPDVLVVRRRRYKVAHPGLARVTPSRGTAYVKCRMVETGQKVAVLCGHRVNDHDGAAGRPGNWFRRRGWHAHRRLDARIVRSLERRGYLVVYGGDVNDRDRGVLAPLVDVFGVGTFDRIAASRPVRAVIRHASRRGGSDHRAYVATLRLPRRSA